MKKTDNIYKEEVKELQTNYNKKRFLEREFNI